MNLDNILSFLGFFFRSPEDKAVIRLALATKAALATPEVQELLAAGAALSATMQAKPPSITPTHPPAESPVEPRSNQANLGAAIADSFKQL